MLKRTTFSANVIGWTILSAKAGIMMFTKMKFSRFFLISFSLWKKPPRAVLHLSSPSTLESLLTGSTKSLKKGTSGSCALTTGGQKRRTSSALREWDSIYCLHICGITSRIVAQATPRRHISAMLLPPLRETFKKPLSGAERRRWSDLIWPRIWSEGSDFAVRRVPTAVLHLCRNVFWSASPGPRLAPAETCDLRCYEAGCLGATKPAEDSIHDGKKGYEFFEELQPRSRNATSVEPTVFSFVFM